MDLDGAPPLSPPKITNNFLTIQTCKWGGDKIFFLGATPIVCMGVWTTSYHNPEGRLGESSGPRITIKTKYIMKNLVINNGNFSTAGNFSGYTALGEKVHIYKRQMETLGWSSDDDVKTPFFVIAENKNIDTIDANGVVTKTDVRLTALSVFKTRDEIKQAHADSAFLDIEVKQAVAEQASKSGLSQSAIDSLLSVAI